MQDCGKLPAQRQVIKITDFISCRIAFKLCQPKDSKLSGCDMPFKLWFVSLNKNGAKCFE